MADIAVGDRVFDDAGTECNVVAVSPVYLDHDCCEVTFSNGETIVADGGHQWTTWDRRMRKAYDFHRGDGAPFPEDWPNWSSANASRRKYDDGARETMRKMRAAGMSSGEIGLLLKRTADAVQQQWNKTDSKNAIRATTRSTEDLENSVFVKTEHNHCIPAAKPLQCANIELPIDPYVLGYLLGDGDTRGGRVACDPPDRAWIMNEFRSAGLEVGEHSDVGHFGVHGILSQWRALGLDKGKHIPPIYLRASVSQRLACVQGLIDSDGSVDSHGSFRFTNTNPLLIAGFQELIASLGCIAHCYERNERVRAGEVNADSGEIAVSASLMLSRLPRKAARARTKWGREQAAHYVVSVKKISPVPVKCIQVDSPNNLYLIGRTMLPTHNSFLVGGLPVYHLLLEGEPRPEAYGAASAREQAGLVFKSASQLVNANPLLLSKLKVLPSTKRIISRDGSGFYAVLSADGNVQDGIEPSLAIRDELHRWTSARAEVLRDVMRKGQISRDQPLDIVITTAGAEFESKLWWGEYEYAKNVLSGAIKDPTHYVAIYEADQKRVYTDPDYWKSREARVAANPSHEDLGGFLRDAAIVGEMNKALADSAERPKYLRYHLNVPLTTLEEPVIDIPKWIESGDPLATEGNAVDLREWPEYDFELLIKKWGLEQRRCWAGVDASWTTDLTAVVFIFDPVDEKEELWTLLPFFFLPRGQLDKIERMCRGAKIRDWVDKGFITATPGSGIDMSQVQERIRWGTKQFNLEMVPYDRLNFRTEAMRLSEEGIRCEEVQQSFLNLSYSTKFLLSAYGDKKFRHGNNPVMNWMASCLQLAYDKKDNCQPNKPERMKSSKRIDGIQATVTGLSQALIAPRVYGGSIEAW
jgi:phage terminase large subunit-like protein